ncbi:DUF3592 domain-containing protein [Actinomadura sp. KC345]|uniref:DUF3592 domain-containing protein n=1 Tax=Actinomadura sp. KC345 TaxID=2530371 RepID=UPI0014044C59|nr:DUF3592 domain-containing protein [Actinomadura sp. KC345]
MSGELIAILATGAVGAGLLVGYLRDVVHVCLLWRRGIRTTGVVVGHQTVGESRRTPVFAFVDQHGSRVAFKSIVRMDTEMEPGQEVPVVYLARKPKVMLLFTRRNMVRSLLENSGLLVLGSVFLGFAVAVVVGWPG